MTTLSLVRGQATTYTLLSMGPRVSLVTCISVPPYVLAFSNQPSASGSHSKKYTRQSAGTSCGVAKRSASAPADR